MEGIQPDSSTPFLHGQLHDGKILDIVTVIDYLFVNHFNRERKMKLSGRVSSAPRQHEHQPMLRDTTAIALQAAIWNHGPISRTQLAGVTGLAPSTITRLTRSLRNLGLIRQLSKRDAHPEGANQ